MVGHDPAAPPSRWDWLSRKGRRALRSLARHARWHLQPASFDVAYATHPARHELTRGSARIGRIGGHPALESGKRHNVALACAILDGIEITPERPFSFWRALGPATIERGFRAGIEIWSGCAIPSVGGGLCLVTNTLFGAALRAGATVLERHAHSRALGDVQTIDATVAYPHVDLRFRPPARMVLRARLVGDELVIVLLGDAPPEPVSLFTEVTATVDPDVHRVRVVRRFASTGAEEVVLDEPKRSLAAPSRSCLDCAIACDAGDRAARDAALVRIVPRAEATALRRGA